MATEPTTGLTYQEAGSLQTDVLQNAELNLFGPAIAGTVTVNFTTDANLTLTAAQYWTSVLILTDTGPVLTVGRDVVFPAHFPRITVFNNTAETVTLKKSGQTGVAVAAGDSATVVSGATDVVLASAGGSVDAEDVAYDNGVSGLTATDVQAAIDELAAGSGAVSSVNGATGAVVLTEGDIVGGINTQTASYTAVLSDEVVEMDVATANNFTVPANASVAFANGRSIEVWQKGAGQTTIVAGSGVTILYHADLTLKLLGQNSGCSLRKVATDTWRIIGQMEPL